LSTKRYARDRICDIADQADLFEYPGAKKPISAVTDNHTRRTFGTARGGKFRLVEADRSGNGKWDSTAWVLRTDVSNVRAE
jgi:hypothetical protein